MDKVLEKALKDERKRQENNIELIASENFVSNDVLKLQGSILTNKYAEGYPSKRYYGGCEYIDIFEEKAREYAKELFNCKYANVQPHSGSSANMAVYRALLNYGDKVMGMNLSNGGHLTHGHKLSFSGKDYEIVDYDVNPVTEQIDYEALEKKALKEKPKMIIAGASAYSRIIDFKRFREIADKIGAYLMVDMAHIAGLVATGLHPSPIPYADVITTTTHKTLRGPRGGLILTNSEEIIKKINKAVFPGIQGGPLEHIIAAKGICFEEANTEEFKNYAKQIIKNANAFANEFVKAGWKVISGGTDNHMFVLNVYGSIGITGKEAEEELDRIHITLNKNQIPNDELPPLKSSGVRIGTPAMTTKGWKEEHFIELAKIIMDYLKICKEGKQEENREEYISKVENLIQKIK